jgi:hypothetical protein
MIPGDATDGAKLFNIAWFRTFNRPGHAQWFDSWEAFEHYITRALPPLYTGAYPRIGTFTGDLVALIKVWRDRDELVAQVMDGNMRDAWETLFELGTFLSYEVVCDLRYELKAFDDRNTFAPPACADAVDTHNESFDHLSMGILECPYASYELADLVHSVDQFTKYQAGGEGCQKFVGRLP